MHLPFSSYDELFVQSGHFNLPNQAQLHSSYPWGWLRLNFAKIFGIRKIDSLGYRAVLA